MRYRMFHSIIELHSCNPAVTHCPLQAYSGRPPLPYILLWIIVHSKFRHWWVLFKRVLFDLKLKVWYLKNKQPDSAEISVTFRVRCFPLVVIFRTATSPIHRRREFLFISAWKWFFILHDQTDFLWVNINNRLNTQTCVAELLTEVVCDLWIEHYVLGVAGLRHAAERPLMLHSKLFH